MSQLRVRVTGLNLDVGEAMRTKITEELNRGIARYSSAKDGDAVVTMAKERHLYIVEILLHLDSKVRLEVKADAAEPHAAFAQALEKIEKRVRRTKRKLVDHHNSDKEKRFAAD
jgi:ribosomal subunit interface protein